MHLADTDFEVRRLQLAVYRAMAPSRRLALALDLSEDIHLVAVDGIRSRNPAFDRSQIRHELLRILHGDGIANLIAEGGAAQH